MSSGKKTSTTTQVSGPPAWAEPYYKTAIGLGQKISSQPFQAYTGPMVAGAGQINPYAQNPYTEQLVGDVTGDITRNFQNAIAPNLMSQFQMGGAFGGSAHQ